MFLGMSVYCGECVCTGLCVYIRCVSVPMIPQRSKVKNGNVYFVFEPRKGEWDEHILISRGLRAFGWVVALCSFLSLVCK